MKKSLKIWIIKLSIIVTVIVFDLLTKYFSAKYFSANDDIVLINGLLALTYTTNTGAAFGIFSSSTAMLTFVSVLFIIILFFYDYSNKEKTALYIAAFSLILGGALGNVIDRIFLGYVRDFLWVASAFVCNVADIALSVGVALYVLHTIMEYAKSKKVKE